MLSNTSSVVRPYRSAAPQIVALALIAVSAGCDARCPAGTVQVRDLCQRRDSDTASDAGIPLAGSGGAGGDAASGGVANGVAGSGANGPAADGGAGSGGMIAAGGTHLSGTVAEACKGNGGKTVCDGQGGLFVCNADESLAMQQACPSVQLCMAGLASKSCAKCVPKQEFSCAGTALAICADDGQSFVKQTDCSTAALCNKIAGMCTSAACASGKAACAGNTLTKCNADGTAFLSQTPCDPGTCDAAGGDCNMCEPGTKKCQGDLIATCDATGQTYATSACPTGNKCVGLGTCGACSTNDDCSAMTMGCKVGACGMGSVCMATNAKDGTTCTAGAKPGTCASGACQCTPQCSGKACGDDGCGGSCGACSGLRNICSANQCVQCTATGGECLDSFDGCAVGMCSAGSCGLKPAASGKACTTLNGSGKCSGIGSCCVPSCSSGACGANSDGCGGACQCTSPQTCGGDGQCAAPVSTGKGLYEACTSGSAPEGDCSSALICTQIGPSNDGPHCLAKAAAGGTCFSSSDVSFMGVVCAPGCMDTSMCPSGLQCYGGGTSQGWCVPP